jgi:hypothetical protein
MLKIEARGMGRGATEGENSPRIPRTGGMMATALALTLAVAS